MSKKVIVSRDDLERLYWIEHKSSIEIGKLFRCHPMTIRNRIREFGIQKRSASDARTRYEKRIFSENITEKAYLLGFRLGDLSAYQTSSRSDVIIIRCHTTQMVQVDLLNKLFLPYGQVTVSDGRYGFNVNCYVDKTFDFLLPKHMRVPAYIERLEQSIWAFIAGYVDAEGSFGINQGKARFKVDSYDVHILEWMVAIFQKSSLSVKFRQIASQGQLQYRLGTFHKDLWRLEINSASSVARFIDLVGPYILHEKRKADMMMCLNNVRARRNKGTVL